MTKVDSQGSVKRKRERGFEFDVDAEFMKEIPLVLLISGITSEDL